MCVCVCVCVEGEKLVRGWDRECVEEGGALLLKFDLQCDTCIHNIAPNRIY